MKLVHIGWKHYDPIKGDYVQVRAERGGGTAKVRLPWATTYDQLRMRAMNSFFKDGMSSIGAFSEMDHFIGVYNSKEDLKYVRTKSGVLPFTLREYYNHKTGDYHLRFYLYTSFRKPRPVFKDLLKKKPIVDISDNDSDSTSDDEMEFPIKPPISPLTPLYSDLSPADTLPQVNLTAPISSHVMDEDVNFLDFESIMKTSAVTEATGGEVGFSITESSSTCTPAKNEHDHFERKAGTDSRTMLIRNERASRLLNTPPPLPWDADAVPLKFRLPCGEIVQRVFSTDQSIQVLFDFVGSHADATENFEISSPRLGRVKNDTKSLNDMSINAPETFDVSWAQQIYEVPSNISPPRAFQDDGVLNLTAVSTSEEINDQLLRGDEEDAQTEMHQLKIHRINIFNELLEIFSDEILMAKRIYFVVIASNGSEEIGQDTGGIYRDVLSTFWQQFYNSCCLGEEERVPVPRHDFQEEKWQSCARILMKGYQDQRYWPLQLSKAFICHCIYGKDALTDELLLRSFERFVDATDRELIRKITTTEKSEIDEDILEEFQDLCSRYDGRKMATTDNIHTLLTEFAHRELIQLTKFIGDEWSVILQQLKIKSYDFTTLETFTAFLETLKPTAKRVASMLEANPQNKNETDCFNYLKRLVRGLSDELLRSFLRYVTGSDALSYDCITVTFRAVHGLQRRPIATTCSCLLELPSTYESFPELRHEFINILKRDDWPMDFA